MFISEKFLESSRPVFKLIDELRRLGINQHVAVPQIVVLGEQSSGKSSVLEAISDIHFPSGVLTRCPTQVTMIHGSKRSVTFKAKETLHTFKDESVKSSLFDMTEMILKLTKELTGDETSFSKIGDFIEIELVGPEYPNLKIVDLPGIVRTESQSETVGTRIDCILDKYLQQERTIILAVISLNEDITQTNVLDYACKVDPDRERTIGVLTKPDLVEKGAEGDIVDIFLNRSKPLLHGYYMLKNSLECETENIETMGEELDWLKNSYYAGTEYSRRRLGADALTTAISNLLLKYSKDSLTCIEENCSKELQRTEEELKKLGGLPPSVPTDCRDTTSDIIHQIVKSLRSNNTEIDHIHECESDYDSDGDSDDDSSNDTENDSKENNSNEKVYSDDEEHTEENEKEEEEKEGEKEEEEEEEDNDYEQEEDDDSIDLYKNCFEMAIKNSRPGFDGEYDKYDTQITEVHKGDYNVGDVVKSHSWDVPQSVTKIGEPTSNDSYEGKVVKLRYYFRGRIAKLIKKSRGCEQPAFMNFELFKSILRSFTDEWISPSNNFADQVARFEVNRAKVLCEKYASEYTSLKNKINSIIEAYYMKSCKECCSKFAAFMESEMSQVTKDEDFYTKLNKIRDDRVNKKIDDFIKKNGKLRKKDLKDILKSDLGSDSDESQEVQEMIDLLKVYWEILSEKYIDKVSESITKSFSSDSFFNVMLVELVEKLVDGCSDQKIKDFFELDFTKKREREELECNQKNMKRACIRLNQGIH